LRHIGVFICHCGHNIAGIVDVEAVAAALRDYPGVSLATTYKYCCSEPGQKLIRDAIQEQGLDGVVVAACSPAMHETTFRRAVSSVGLNPYLCECANIREQCSWVHQDDPQRATAKAIAIAQTVVEKVKGDEPLEMLVMAITRRALVIGGGPAGLQAALDIADAGYPVTLVERSDHLGGKMAELSGTYLNFDAAPGLLARKIEEVTQHPHIQVLTNSEVLGVSGYVGNFRVELGTLVPGSSVPGSLVPGTLVEGQSQPPHTNLPVCQSTNLPSHQSTTLDVGAIIVATGYDRYPLSKLAEYGGGGIPDVVDTLTFEAMLAQEQIRRPSDGGVPREVVFVQCAGSRDPEHGVPYCSKICCMAVAKQATMYAQRVPDGQAYVFYIDIRSAGRGYEEYVDQAMQEHGVLYVRGKVSRLFAEDGKVVVWGVDTLSGQAVEVAADLVVLATPMLPSEGTADLAQRLRAATGADGFFTEAHPKLRPVESLTAGVYLAGAAQGPKDIPETVSQASGAAAKVLSLFSRREMTQEPTVAYVVEELCSGCGACVEVCPYEARSIHPLRNVALVNAALCQNCGACVVACPNKASQIFNWRPEQILAMLEAVV
jgi:heterodisulfide reductase subunit A